MPAAPFMSPVARPGLGLNIRSNAESNLTPRRKALLLSASTPRRKKSEEEQEHDESGSESQSEEKKEAEEFENLVHSDDEPLKLTDDENVTFCCPKFLYKIIGSKQRKKKKTAPN